MNLQHLTRLLAASIAVSALVGCGAAKQEAPPPPRIDVTTERAEISNADVGNVQAKEVTLNETVAHVVTATQVVARNSRLDMIQTGAIDTTNSKVGFVQATNVTLGQNTGVSFVRAQTVTVQSNAGIAVLIADTVEGDVQPAITKEGAIAIGVATGATVVALMLIINALSQQ